MEIQFGILLRTITFVPFGSTGIKLRLETLLVYCSMLYIIIFRIFMQHHGNMTSSEVTIRLLLKINQTFVTQSAEIYIELTEYSTAKRRISSASYHFEKSLSAARAMKKH